MVCNNGGFIKGLHQTDSIYFIIAVIMNAFYVQAIAANQVFLGTDLRKRITVTVINISNIFINVFSVYFYDVGFVIIMTVPFRSISNLILLNIC